VLRVEVNSGTPRFGAGTAPTNAIALIDVRGGEAAHALRCAQATLFG
jgi:hypothetical protein